MQKVLSMAKQKKQGQQYGRKQLEQEFDKMRRKNRRRLMLALILVVIASVVLIQVMNQSHDNDINATVTLENNDLLLQEQQSASDVDLTLLPDDSESTEESAIASSALMSASDILYGPNNTHPEIPTAAVAKKTEVASEKPKAAEQANQVIHPVPVIIINQKQVNQPSKEAKQTQTKAEPKKQAVKEAAAVPQQKEGLAKQPAPSTTDTSNTKTSKVDSKTNTQNNNKNTTTNTTTSPAVNKTTTTNKPSALDILNGKAVNTTTSKPTPSAAQDILNGKTTSSKASPAPQKVIIQVAALSNAAQANAMKQQLSQLGVNAYLVKSQTAQGEITRVRVGPFNSRVDAERTLAKVNQQGHQGIIVSQ